MAEAFEIEEIEERVILVGVSEQDGDDAEDSVAELAELVKQEFAKMEIEENTYKSLVHSIAASKNGNYVFHSNFTLELLI